MQDKKPLFESVDCIELYVPSLREGIGYYCDQLGLKLLWKSATSAGLGIDGGTTEVVIQTQRKAQEVDFKVASVVDAVVEIQKAGGQVLSGPFEIPIGKCAVVRDPWGNRYVLLDLTKGTYLTDEGGNIIGLNPPD